jgi:hydrogenase maturation protein HypF
LSTAAPALAETPDPVSTVIRLPRSVPPVLGLGAHLKNTVCLARGAKATVSRDIGNLESGDAVRRFEETVDQLLQMEGVVPTAVAHDLHPDFYGTRYARGLGMEAIAVQHHHAHVAAVMAEHGSEGPVLGLALDGFGLGPGDQSWGGELLLVDRGGYRRLGHMALLKQPGGDAAARQPWRMGASALHALGRGDEIVERYKDFNGAGVIADMLSGNVNCPPTSSCGRLFDAACGLLGVKPMARFEGEAPMELEKLVTRPQPLAGGWRLEDGVLDMLPLLDRLRGLAPAEGADLFHGTLTTALAHWAAWAADETGLGDVVMSGGCMLNRVVREGLSEALARRRLRPLPARRLTPGDGAISLGQAWAVGLMKG